MDMQRKREHGKKQELAACEERTGLLNIQF